MRVTYFVDREWGLLDRASQLGHWYALGSLQPNWESAKCGNPSRVILLSMRVMRLLLVILSIGLCSAVAFAESAAGVHWTAPAGWKTDAPQPMRAATYTVAAVPGDKANADCVVYFFGAGQGGTVDANIERWKGQF